MRPFWVYIVGNINSGTIYVGSTDDMARRAYEHRFGLVSGFSTKYRTKALLWFEAHETRASALLRERQIKRWKREWKLNLIRALNPELSDLYDWLNV